MFKVIKKNQIIIFVGALMLIVAGYINFSGDGTVNNLIPTSTLADSEEMASIGDAKLVSANVVEENGVNNESSVNEGNLENVNEVGNTTTNENVANANTSINNETSTGETTSETMETGSTALSNINADNKNDENNYFIQSRLDRDTMYSQSLDTYQKIIDNENVSEDQKAIAQNEITKINNQRNSIMIAENLIKVKGFEDLIIFVNGENVSVIIKADKLEEKDIAQIQNIITRELGVKVENINISNK